MEVGPTGCVLHDHLAIQAGIMPDQRAGAIGDLAILFGPVVAVSSVDVDLAAVDRDLATIPVINLAKD